MKFANAGSEATTPIEREHKKKTKKEIIITSAKK